MNKEEIEQAKEDLCFMNEGDYITREMSNSKDILIKYIESLELINETWQVSNEMFRERTKELEQKESILDKVTEYIKNYIDDKQNVYEAISESYICQTDEDEYIKEKELAIIKGQKQVLRNVLNSIKGEKK